MQPTWNLIGTFMFMGSGACAIMTWQGETRAKLSSSSTLTEREYNRSDISASKSSIRRFVITEKAPSRVIRDGP